jgi:hypothetical protein
VTRIFTILAWLAILMVATNLILGLSLGDLRQLDPTVLQWARVHRLLGVAAALAVVLVNSIVVTYFIGTSRWAKEVVETYSLNVDFVRRTTALKRRTFPWATLSMLVIVGVIALGGAADPASGKPGTEHWVSTHLIGSIAGLAFVAWASVVEWNNIYRNQQAIHDILAEVRRIRQERGWEV